MKAVPSCDAYARKTPTWQFSVVPAVPLYWRATPQDFRPLLQKAGLVHDEHASGLISEMLDDVVPEVVADAVGVPGGGTQQALHAPGPGFADRLRELPAVLALDALQQAGQVAPGSLPRFAAGETVSDPRVQLRPRVRASLDRGQPESTRRPVHLLPSACKRGKRTATTS